MDRPRQAATKVTDFRKYHLLGDLEEEVQGLVDTRVGQFEMAKTPEELQWQLEEEKKNSKKIQDSVERAKIHHELEIEKMKQQQWQTALEKIEEAKAQAAKEHSKCLCKYARTM